MRVRLGVVVVLGVRVVEDVVGSRHYLRNRFTSDWLWLSSQSSHNSRLLRVPFQFGLDAFRSILIDLVREPFRHIEARTVEDLTGVDVDF